MRTSCATLANRARLVSIDDGRLAEIATELPSSPDWPNPTTSPVDTTDSSTAVGSLGRDDRAGERGDDQPSAGEIEAMVRRIVALDAINFGSGYHDIVDKDPGRSGARTMAARFSRALRPFDGLPPAAALDWLCRLSPATCADVFGQSLDHPEQGELMALFATALTTLGRFVAETFDGSFTNLVLEADRSARSLTSLLLAMPLYQDRATVTDEDGHSVVHFYKRAQITAADLARGLPHWRPARFTDLDQLTAFADNLVPHVLRIDGILGLDPAVVERIEGRALLEPAGRAEVELRACGVEAVERLVAAIDRPGVRAMDIDLALWTRGAADRYKARPRHRTRCTFY